MFLVEEEGKNENDGYEYEQDNADPDHGGHGDS